MACNSLLREPYLILCPTLWVLWHDMKNPGLWLMNRIAPDLPPHSSLRSCFLLFEVEAHSISGGPGLNDCRLRTQGSQHVITLIRHT